MIKSVAFPNKLFNTQQEYFRFAEKHKVFGNAAHQLKRNMMKSKSIGQPKVTPKSIEGKIW